MTISTTRFRRVFFYANDRARSLPAERPGEQSRVLAPYAPGALPVFIDDARLRELWPEPSNINLVVEKPSVPRIEGILGKGTLYAVRESGGKFLFSNHHQ